MPAKPGTHEICVGLTTRTDRVFAEAAVSEMMINETTMIDGKGAEGEIGPADLPSRNPMHSCGYCLAAEGC